MLRIGTDEKSLLREFCLIMLSWLKVKFKLEIYLIRRHVRPARVVHEAEHWEESTAPRLAKHYCVRLQKTCKQY